MKKYCGFYEKEGYEIYRVIEGDENELVYTAGNSPLDSAAVVAEGLPLRTIRAYCIQTGRDIAEENGGLWLGCERM